MMYAGRVTLAIALVAASVFAAPNHLKAVVVDTDPAPRETSASASFGPYSAKAGLGNSPKGGVLFAAADSPHGSASAGLGGDKEVIAVETVQTSVGSTGVAHKPVIHHQGPTLFDGIFNIPISVLQAVNSYLNNRGPVTKPIYRRRHRPAVGHKTVIPEQNGGESETPKVASEAVADKTSVAESEAQSSAGAQPDHRTVVVQKRVNFDDIFNIPISALKSVNQMLNNGKK